MILACGCLWTRVWAHTHRTYKLHRASVPRLVWCLLYSSSAVPFLQIPAAWRVLAERIKGVWPRWRRHESLAPNHNTTDYPSCATELAQGETRRLTTPPPPRHVGIFSPNDNGPRQTMSIYQQTILDLRTCHDSTVFQCWPRPEVKQSPLQKVKDDYSNITSLLEHIPFSTTSHLYLQTYSFHSFPKAAPTLA